MLHGLHSCVSSQVLINIMSYVKSFEWSSRLEKRYINTNTFTIYVVMDHGVSSAMCNQTLRRCCLTVLTVLPFQKLLIYCFVVGRVWMGSCILENVVFEFILFEINEKYSLLSPQTLLFHWLCKEFWKSDFNFDQYLLAVDGSRVPSTFKSRPLLPRLPQSPHCWVNLWVCFACRDRC